MIDVTDQGLIRAERAAVFNAIIDLMAGDDGWWTPHLRVRAVGEHVRGKVGSLSEISVPGRARFIARMEEVQPPSLLRVAYISGDFSGTGLWTFESEAEGTRISLRWQATPTRWWMRWLASKVQRNHSLVMQIGFRALDAHLRAAVAA